MVKMLVPHRHAGALIGKGGENMKRLEGESGARIKLSQSSEFYPGTGERVLSARGEPEQVCEAFSMVLRTLDASNRSSSDDGGEPASQPVRLVIPERATGSLIGKGGENIRRLQEESNSRISVSSKVRLGRETETEAEKREKARQTRRDTGRKKERAVFCVCGESVQSPWHLALPSDRVFGFRHEIRPCHSHRGLLCSTSVLGAITTQCYCVVVDATITITIVSHTLSPFPFLPSPPPSRPQQQSMYSCCAAPHCR